MGVDDVGVTICALKHIPAGRIGNQNVALTPPTITPFIAKSCEIGFNLFGRCLAAFDEGLGNNKLRKRHHLIQALNISLKPNVIIEQ